MPLRYFVDLNDVTINEVGDLPSFFSVNNYSDLLNLAPVSKIFLRL